MNEWGEKTQQHYTKIGQQLDDIVSGRVVFVVQAHQPGPAALPGRDGGEDGVTAPAAASVTASGSSSASASAPVADAVPLRLRTELSAAQDEISAGPPSYKLSRM